MDAMSMPAPDDPGRAPVWENYVVAQTVQAMLGQVPEHALAVGVETSGQRVRLRLQLSEATDADEAHINDIVSELEALLGDEVQVDVGREIVREPRVSPSGAVRWVYLARV
jgi:hypothetical protein